MPAKNGEFDVLKTFSNRTGELEENNVTLNPMVSQNFPYETGQKWGYTTPFLDKPIAEPNQPNGPNQQDQGDILNWKPWVQF